MIINGKEEHIATPITVAELIEQRGLRAERVAVELNGEIVPRALRAQTLRTGRLNPHQASREQARLSQT